MGKIKLNNMVFYGYHGVMEQEKDLGGKFEVDLEFEFDMSAAVDSDQLQDTISYVEIYQKVKSVITTSKFHLIESLAGKILRAIFETYPTDRVTIRIRKPNAPLRGVLDNVEVEITRKRSEMNNTQ